MEFSSDCRLGGLSAAIAVGAVGVVALFLHVSTPSAQEPYVHVNPVVAKLSKGEHVFGVPTSDYSMENARGLARAPIDYVTLDFEHTPLNVEQIELFLAGMVDRRAILEKRSLQHDVAVFAEFPQYAFEQTYWVRKQALDIGVMGLLFTNLETKEQALKLVQMMRYNRPKSDPLFEPQGQRGSGGGLATWFWGLSGAAEYRQRADVWPLNPRGELIALAAIETELGVRNADQIAQVPGISGLYLTSGGDLGMSMAVPSGDPALEAARLSVLKVCQARKIICGGTVTTNNIAKYIADGYKILTVNPGAGGGLRPATDAALRAGRAALAAQKKQ